MSKVRSSGGRSGGGGVSGRSAGAGGSGRRRGRGQSVTGWVLVLVVLGAAASGAVIGFPHLQGALAEWIRGPAPAVEPGSALRLRVATYNVRFETSGVYSEERLRNIQRVVARLDADILGLVEMHSPADTQRIVGPGYDVFMLDVEAADSDSVAGRIANQEVALAVRKGIRPVSTPRMVYPNERQAFPGYRHLLEGIFELPNGQRVRVYVVHAKSRAGAGRDATDQQRIRHSQLIIEHFRREKLDLSRDLVAVIGDFNDTPDDASLNILETGQLDAPARMEEEPDTYLVNLGELRWARDQVTYDPSVLAVMPHGRLSTVVPGARARNFGRQSRGPVMFDMILVSPALASRLAPGLEGMQMIYDRADLRSGQADLDPSDHIPVFADFMLD